MKGPEGLKDLVEDRCKSLAASGLQASTSSVLLEFFSPDTSLRRCTSPSLARKRSPNQRWLSRLFLGQGRS